MAKRVSELRACFTITYGGFHMWEEISLALESHFDSVSASCKLFMKSQFVYGFRLFAFNLLSALLETAKTTFGNSFAFC